MRLFHFSDTHLGHQQYTRTDEAGLNQREVDIYRAFHAVIDAAVAERPDLVVHSGDLFDGVRPGNRALSACMEGLLKLSRAGIPAVLIAGNHEHPKLRETGSPFRLFAHLPGIHVVYQGRAERIDLDLPDGPVHVHAVPQCQDAQALAAEIADLRREPGRNILVVHGAVPALPAFAHAEFNELTLDPSWFAGFDYVALGHYHGCQQVAPNAWYSGAPERVSMAESGQEKGFLDVRLGPAPAALDARFRPLPARPYADLPELHGEGLGLGELKSAATAALGRVPPGAVARLRLVELDAGLRGGLDVRGIREAGQHLLHLELRTAWRDEGVERGGHAEVGPLWSELEAFLAAQPAEPAQRDLQRRLARELLDATEALAQEARP